MDNYNDQSPFHEPSQPPVQSHALGITSLVTGIIGLIFAFCCLPLGIILGLVALICGIIGKGKGQNYALAGIILGALAIGLSVVSLFIGLATLGNIDWEELFREFEVQ